MSETKNILVIRFSSMGDVILTAPLYVALKKRYPDSSIVLLTDSNYSELFRDNRFLSEVIGIRKNDWSALEKVKGVAWDLVIDLQKNSRSQQVAEALSRSGKTGFLDKMHLERALLLYLRIVKYPQNNGIVSRYLRAAGLDSTEIPPLQLDFNQPAPSSVNALLESSGIVRPSIALFPFSAWSNKTWPMEYFVEVGSFFTVKGWNILIMGGPSDREFSDILASYIGSHCYSFAGRLTLYECGTVLKTCALALGNDTGLTHLARACGVRTGVIFGPTTHHFGFYPYGEPPFKVFESRLWCRPCHAHGGNVCLLCKLCMRNVVPENVIKGLMDLMDINLGPKVS